VAAAGAELGHSKQLERALLSGRGGNRVKTTQLAPFVNQMIRKPNAEPYP